MRLFLFVCCLQAIYAINYIINGDFSEPACPGSFIYYTVSNWTGNDFVLEGRYNFGLNNSGQYINLQEHTSSLGFIQQTVVLPSAGTYYLTFYWRTDDVGPIYHYLLVFWNEVVIKTITILNITTVCFENITVIGKSGSNVVKFMEPPGAPASGYFLDRISLEGAEQLTITEVNKPYLGLISQQSLNNLAFLLSTYPGQVNIFRNIYLLIDDLWLYNYDSQTYQGMISCVFWTVAEVQNLKFDIVQSFINISEFKNHLAISDYRNFSTAQFVKIENASSVFLDSNFAFLIFSVPQNILIGLALFVLFRLTRQHRMSRYLRKYYFFKASLLQVLIESNLAYFSFVCFNNLFQTFCFKWQDKAALIFTVVFLFGLLAFSFTYYYLIKIFLGKDTYHFVDGLYRCNASFDYLTLVQLVRNLFRGAICSVLHYHYGSQLLLLMVNELTSLILCLRFQLTFSIFHSSTMYCLSLIYRSLFVFLNAVLYLYWLMSTQIEDVKVLLLDLQSGIVYLFASVIILEMLCKLLPIHKKSKSKKQNIENKSRLNKDQKIKQNALQMEAVKQSRKLIGSLQHLKCKNSAVGLNKSILTPSRHIKGKKENKEIIERNMMRKKAFVYG